MTTYTSVNGNGVVDYWDSTTYPILNTAKNVMFLSSGGTDSTLSLYLLLLENEKLGLNLNIEILTAYETNRSKVSDIDMPKAIIAKMKELFPNANIISHTFVDCDARTKNLTMRPIMEARFAEGTIDLEVDGVTAAPSLEDRTAINMNEEETSLRRIFGIMHTDKGMYYHPLAKVNKKFVRDMYYQLGIEETLLPLTWSCTSNNVDLLNPVPCGTCWWCKERKWAFGVDGSEPII